MFEKEDILVIEGDGIASLSPASLKILARRRCEVLYEASDKLHSYQQMLSATTRQFPDVYELMHFLGYKGDEAAFIKDYKKCCERDKKNQNALIKKLMGKKFNNINQVIKNQLEAVQQELTYEDITQPLTEKDNKPIKLEGQSLMVLHRHYHNYLRREAQSAFLQKVADLNRFERQLDELEGAKDPLEKKLLSVEARLKTHPNMLLANQREGLEEEWRNLQLSMDDYQQKSIAIDTSYLALSTPLTKELIEKQDKLRWENTVYPLKKNQIAQDVRHLFDQYQELRAKQIRQAQRKRFFGTDETMSHSVFGRYLEERAKTFSLRDSLSRFAFWFFCCFGYKTEAQIRRDYIEKLKQEMDVYVEDPKELPKLKTTLVSGIGMFAKKKSRRGELSLVRQLEKMEMSLG